MTFGMKTGEVIGWEPAEAGSFFFDVLFLLYFFFIFYFLSMSIFSYKTTPIITVMYENIKSVRWRFTLEASFTKYIFFCISNA